MDETKIYEIGGRVFSMRDLGPAQTLELLAFLDSVGAPVGGGINEILTAVGPNIYTAVAIVLLDEDGTIPWLKSGRHGNYVRTVTDYDALAARTEFLVQHLHNNLLTEMVEDFFVCNPLSQWLARGGKALVTLFLELARTLPPTAGEAGATGLTSSSSPQPAETSPGATPSVTATPGASSGPTSSVTDGTAATGI
jgi:hypothetical protein